MNRTFDPRPIVITYPFVLGEINGGARMTREIARQLGRCDQSVILMPISRSVVHPKQITEFMGYQFDAELEEDNVRLVRLPAHPTTRYLDGLGVRRAVQELLRANRPKIVLSYYREGAFLGSLLRKQHIPFGFISTWQSYRMVREQTLGPGVKNKILRLSFDWLIKRPHRQARILFATSCFTKQELVDVLEVESSRVQVCYLGVDPHFADIPRKAFGDRPTILFFGRLVASKGLRDALQALQRLRSGGHHNWRFKLFGDGDHRWVMNLIHQTGLEGHVLVNPAVSTERLLLELSQADFSLMPSHAEAFGLSFAEAQAAGLPVVAYAAGSVPEIVIHERTGLLAPLKDVDKLAEYTLRMLKNPEEARSMGLAGREYVRATFTWENTARTILAHLEDLVG
jgi:glycosyltransferase involved in cell wall biosynthesis